MTWVGCQLQSIFHPGGGALHGNITLHITYCSDTKLVTCTSLLTIYSLSHSLENKKLNHRRSVSFNYSRYVDIYFICDDVPLDIHLYWWSHDHAHEIWRLVPGTRLWLVSSRPQSVELKVFVANRIGDVKLYNVTNEVSLEDSQSKARSQAKGGAGAPSHSRDARGDEIETKGCARRPLET